MGKHHSAETRAKIRTGNLGKYCSLETRARCRAARVGKHLTAETRAKIGAAARGRQGPWFGKHFSVEHRAKLSATRQGARNNNWRGGTSFVPYVSDWTATLRRSIRERDHYVCRLCGAQQTDRAFDVHHVDYDKTNCDPVNLVTLCSRCHSMTNGNRQRWTAWFRCITANSDGGN